MPLPDPTETVTTRLGSRKAETFHRPFGTTAHASYRPERGNTRVPLWFAMFVLGMRPCEECWGSEHDAR